MRVNKAVNGLRDFNEDLDEIYVVIGDGPRSGQIKTEYFSINKEPALAKIEWSMNDGRRTRIKAITLDSDLSDRGWMLLEEEYAKEGRMKDFEQFKDWRRACRADRVFPQGTTEERKEQRAPFRNDACPGFPTKLLPHSVQELHKRGVGPTYYWQPKEEGDAGEAELAPELSSDSGVGAGAPSDAKARGRRS